jgi:hypothetical protein
MTRDCYQIITDPQELLKFIDWLPELAAHEKYYLCLFSRKKYCSEVPYIKSDKSQLKRFLSDKLRMLEKIEQLECPIGAFRFKEGIAPQESLALYITPNPRDMWKAAFRSIKQLATVLECEGKSSNPHQEVMSEIHRTCGNKVFIDFDVDTKDETIIRAAVKLVDGHCEILETRGGYHIMVKTKDAKAGFTEKLWYKQLTADPNSMIPVPGCYQGGFSPRFVDVKKFL